MTDVWVVRGRSKSGKPRYHRMENCRHLRRAENIDTVSPEEAERRGYPKCRWCWGDRQTTNGRSVSTLASRLLHAHPDEVSGD